ncbi:MAG: hypothetical protein J6A01_09490 [Proteobacteria bacterium]|nr:hypothetical protein [Pseudomonadota bacterium]
MNANQSSFIGHALKSGIHGIKGISYPVWIQCFGLVFRWGMAFSVLVLIQYLLTGNTDVVSLNTFWKWAIFMGFPIMGWWVFTSACKVAWWRHFERASCQTESRGPWIKDLPAMMGIDFVFGLLKGLCYLAFGLCTYYILVSHAPSAIILMAFSLWMLLISSVLHPAVVAQRMISGPGFMRALSMAASTIVSNPFKTLAVRFLPYMAIACLWGGACIEMGLDHLLIAAFLLTISVFIPLIYPVFWIELMREREQLVMNNEQ